MSLGLNIDPLGLIKHLYKKRKTKTRSGLIMHLYNNARERIKQVADNKFRPLLTKRDLASDMATVSRGLTKPSKCAAHDLAAADGRDGTDVKLGVACPERQAIGREMSHLDDPAQRHH